jgi:predicted lipoprotein with Yx(FWY)xxD motif
MRSKTTYAALAALAAVVVFVIAACGGGGGNGAEESASGGTGAATTVSVSDADGVGDVLVDKQGSALYASAQEADGTVLCSNACATIWVPLTINGGRPTGSDGLTADLGTVMRPDGSRQVTFDGRPLYSFAEDSDPGDVTGNGFSDMFGSQAFTWHVATPTGVSTSSENTNESSEYGGGYSP